MEKPSSPSCCASTAVIMMAFGREPSESAHNTRNHHILWNAYIYALTDGCVCVELWSKRSYFYMSDTVCECSSGCIFKSMNVCVCVVVCHCV